MRRVARTSGRRLRSYAFTLVTTAIVLILALAEWGAEKYVAEHSRAAGITLEIGIVLVAALVFRPIHQRVEAAAEQAFYRRKHQALTALAKFRRELSSFNDVQQLLRRVIEAVEQHLEAHSCAVYLRRERYRAEASSFDVAAGDVDLDDPLVVRLRSSGAPAQPALLNSSARGTHAFAMTAAGDLVGFLLVECRDSEYDDEEAQMLTGLAQDLAVALGALDPRLRARKPVIPNNIPLDIPAPIGRERELGEIKAAIAQSRLVTLTGPGGVGKTCVALHCASEAVAQHEHGAWFVNLAPLADGTLVAAAILQVLDAGAADEGGDLERLLEYLRDRDALLVLDNCEQILRDAAWVVAQIRARCPNVSVLATSREMLHLDGEQVYQLGPLRIEASIELFYRRAGSVSPGFDAAAAAEAVRFICERLDGIPLAIELAAARTRTLSANEIVNLLNERFRLLTGGARTALARQQTLAAAIEWSYDLLTPQEQSAFRRLAAFRGSFSLAAAATVCGRDVMHDEFHALDVLTSLVDKSLVTVTIAITTRYRFLETIREFAWQKTLEHQAAAIAQRQHAAYFAALASQAYHEFDTRLPEGWLDRLAPDIDNFRAALVFALEGPGDRHLGAQLAADCGPMFLRLELLSEGLRWCEAARTVPGLSPATAGRIEYAASMLYNNARMYPPALACAERAVLQYRGSDDRRGLIRALSQTAHQYAHAGRHGEAAEAAAQAIEGARDLGEPRVLIAVLRRCAYALPPHEIARARELFKEALSTAEAAQDPEEICMLLQWWAGSEAAAQCYDRAMQLAVRALDCAAPETTMYLESDIAGYALAAGNAQMATAHGARALALALEFRHDALIALALAYASRELNDPKEAALLFGYASARLRALRFQGDRAEKAALFNVLHRIEARLEAREVPQHLREGGAFSEERALQMIRAESTLRRSGDSAVAGGDGVRALLGQ